MGRDHMRYCNQNVQMGVKMKEQFTLGMCIIIAAAVFGMFFYESRVPDNTVRVVGAATKRFDSDIVKWRLTLSRSVNLTDVVNGYTQIANDLNVVKQVLKDGGIEASQINVQPANAQPTYSQAGGVSGYTIQQPLFVISTDVAKLEGIALNPTTILGRGVVLQYANLEYYSSHLSDIKRELLAEATQDAKRRAEEIAKNAGMTAKTLVSARSGVFQITEPYSTEISDYGVFNPSTKTKDITVTVNASFVMK